MTRPTEHHTARAAAELDTLRTPLDKLPNPLPIPTVAAVAGPPPYPARLRLVPPGSKSITNRALLLAALADGPSVIRKPLLDADDALRMLAALHRLGVKAEPAPDASHIVVHGRAGSLAAPGDEPLFLNNAGTATRFLTAAALLAEGPVTIDGNTRMRERPINELLTLLRQLGATVEELREPGFVPVRITPPAEPTADTLDVPTTQSSQFISALCIVAPWLPNGLTLNFTGEITSRTYLDMTVSLMQSEFGAHAEWLDGTTLRIEPTGLMPTDYEVEPDASGATYLFAAAALLPSFTIRVPGLAFTSLQSDARFLLPLQRMGCSINYAAGAADCTGPTVPLRAIDTTDFEPMPDAAMTLAAAAAFADGPTTITGLRTLRVKETDRIAATAAELARVNVQVRTTDDTITVEPPPEGPHAPPEGVVFRTYDDHRMAMSMSLVAMRTPGCSIAEPSCVAKTYPNFFQHLAAVYDAAAARSRDF